MPTGFIAKMVPGKGIGFITPRDGGRDVFFHCSAVPGNQFDQLEVGQSVSYDLDQTEQTSERPRAVKVVPCDESPPGRTAAPDPPVARHPRARRRKPTWRK
jgi:CspA family cold shock protein